MYPRLRDMKGLYLLYLEILQIKIQFMKVPNLSKKGRIFRILFLTYYGLPLTLCYVDLCPRPQRQRSRRRHQSRSQQQRQQPAGILRRRRRWSHVARLNVGLLEPPQRPRQDLQVGGRGDGSCLKYRDEI